METSFFHSQAVQPFASYGLHGALFEFDADTIIYTWIALGVIALIAVAGRYALRRPTRIMGYTTLTMLKSFKQLIEQSTHTFEPRYYFFITSLFMFIFVCNALVLLPGLEEPTKNLNTTFALALISFLYVQRELMKNHGMLGYLQEYFKIPFALNMPAHLNLKNVVGLLARIIANGCAAILSFPLELLGKLSNILSLSLRLFGNIFGSSIMIDMFRHATVGSRLTGLISAVAGYHIALGIIFAPLLLALVSAVSLILSFGFGVLESLVQAFVFSVLTLTYIALATQHKEH